MLPSTLKSILAAYSLQALCSNAGRPVPERNMSPFPRKAQAQPSPTHEGPGEEDM